MKGLKTYFTYLNRNKLFTVVNVTGLSISLMFVLLIANMVTRQLTVDKGIKDPDHTYVLANEQWAGGHYNLGDKLQSRYPELEDWTAVSGADPILFTADSPTPVEITSMIVKKNFFDFFGYRLLEGNAKDVLMSKNNIVLTRSAAIKYFGSTQVMGKTLKSSQLGEQTFTVTGVAADFDNSLIPSTAEAILPFEVVSYINYSASMEDAHMSNAASTILFFRTQKGSDPNAKADDMAAFIKEFFWIYQFDTVKKVVFIPIRDFYFSDTPSAQDLNQYSLKLVMIFFTIGLLILLMAVFNYVSMSVAQTSYRAKEMATRRLLGSSRPDIFWRLITESFLMTLGAFLVGLLLAKAAEPQAMELLNVRLNIIGDLTATTAICYLLLVLFLSLLSGFAPATILSRYNPMDVVKGTFRRKTKALYLRLLNIFQSGLTVAMLTCALFLSVQIYRIMHAPMGYDYENVIHYPAMGAQNTRLFRDEAKKLPFVKEVSLSCGTPIDGGNNLTTYIPSADSVHCMSFQIFVADSAFINMFKIQITEDRHLGTGKNHYFVSESALKELNSIGYDQYYPQRNNSRTQIAGQFRDFNIRSIMTEKHPLAICILPSDSISPWDALVQVTDGDLTAHKRQLDRLYSDILHGTPFESTWYKDRVRDVYNDITRLNKLVVIFTAAALLISLLGLTAMSLYFIAQRKRDMAIRKVFGSNAWAEQWRLIKFSLTSLAYSLIIALPLMLFGIHQINKVVDYDTPFPWWVPPAAFAIVSLITIGSVWLISRNATHENPVNNLKTE